MAGAVTLATVTVKGITYWVARWSDPETGKRRGKSLGRYDQVSERAASKKAALLETEFDAKPYLRSQGQVQTLGEYIEAFLTAKRAQGAKPKTLREYEFVARLLRAVIDPSRPINMVNQADARRFRDRLFACELETIKVVRKTAEGKEVRPRLTRSVTATKYLSKARSIFAQAIADMPDALTLNPFAGMRLAKIKARLWHKVSADEFWRLYNAASPSWRIALALARLAGMPRSDIAALTWDRVKLAENCISYRRTKTGIDVTAPIGPELRPILLEARQTLGLQINGPAYVVPRPLPFANVGRDLEVLCRKAGVEPYADPFHTLRKSAIDDWAKMFDCATVQKWAGHVDVKTTLTFYAQAGKGEIERAAAVSTLSPARPAPQVQAAAS